MSGSLSVAAASFLPATGFLPVGTAYVNDLLTSIAPRVDFNNDGTCTQHDASGANVSTFSWGVPTTVGIGSSYWIKFVLVSSIGTNTAIGGTALNVVSSLSPGQFLTVNASALNASTLRNFSYQIFSDSGGSILVASGTIRLQSDRT